MIPFMFLDTVKISSRIAHEVLFSLGGRLTQFARVSLYLFIPICLSPLNSHAEHPSLRSRGTWIF